MLVLSGDHPLLSSEIDRPGGGHARPTSAPPPRILTTEELDPAGYGRIVRASDGSVERIVETKYTEGLSRRRAGHTGGQPRHLRLRRRTCGAPSTRWARNASEIYLTGVFPILRERGRRPVSQLTDGRLGCHGRQHASRPDGGRPSAPYAESWTATLVTASPSSDPTRPGSRPGWSWAPTPPSGPG